jgi:hypothetical protein
MLKHIHLQVTDKRVGQFQLEKLHLLQNCTELVEEAELILAEELADMFKLHFLVAAVKL